MEIIKDVIAGLAVVAIAWAIGLPLFVARQISRRLSGWRLSKNLATGLFTKAALDNAVSYYVRPMYSNLDPANEWEPAIALINARADLFDMMKRFLHTQFVDQKHMLLFADSGMGKTSFLLNYLNYNYRLFNVRKKKILFVSLGQASADELLRSVPIANRGDINLFLDALDEDPRAMGDVQARVQELLFMAEGFRTVVITCRSQFFRSDEHIPVRTGLVKVGPVPLGREKHYSFFRVYLSPFDEAQVSNYLSKRFPGIFAFNERRRAAAMVARIPSLSVRPMLLAHMPEMLESGQCIATTVEVYEVMVAAWVRRESAWIEPQDLEALSQSLADDLYAKRVERGGEFAEPDEITSLALDFGISISPDLATSRSLLNRTGDGRYKFAHRSIMEYFVVKSLLERQPEEEVALTDQMAHFLFERLGCWSDPVQALISTSTVSVMFITPSKRLGLETNFELFRPLAEVANIQEILRIDCHSVISSTPAHNLEELVADMSMSAFAVDVAQLREVRILFERLTSSRSSSKAHISIWMNSYFAVTEVEINDRALAHALAASGPPGQEILLSASPAALTNQLSRAIWTRSSRVCVPPLTIRENPVSLRGNGGVGFYYDPSRNNLAVSVLKLQDPHGPFSAFGIFGAPVQTLSVSDRPYALVAANARNAWRELPA